MKAIIWRSFERMSIGLILAFILFLSACGGVSKEPDFPSGDDPRRTSLSDTNSGEYRLSSYQMILNQPGASTTISFGPLKAAGELDQDDSFSVTAEKGSVENFQMTQSIPFIAHIQKDINSPFADHRSIRILGKSGNGFGSSWTMTANDDGRKDVFNQLFKETLWDKYSKNYQLKNAKYLNGMILQLNENTLQFVVKMTQRDREKIFKATFVRQ